MLCSNRFFGSIALVLSAGALPALAQGTLTANMTLTVVDTSGAPVLGATVFMTSPSLQGQRRVVTDQAGKAIVRLLPPGQYTVVVSKAGLNSVTLSERIGLEQTFSPRVVMASLAAQTVEVIATSTAADKTETKTATNYTKTEVDALPISRNSALDIAILSPGVAKSANADKGLIEIRGASGTGNLVMVDGQNVADNVYNGQRIGTIFDAVEETQVLQGAIPAEYGYVEGGVINQVTKVGGNTFTGEVRYDLSNPRWNAMKPLQSRTSVPDALLKSRTVSVGGPIIKDKLWFFTSYFDTHPSAPRSLYGAELVGIASLDYTEVRNDYRRMFKLTYSPNESNTLTFNYNNSSNAYNRDFYSGDPSAMSNFKMKGEFWNVSWRSILSDNIALNVRFGRTSGTMGQNKNALEYSPARIYNNETGLYYGMGPWDPNDPKPDERINFSGSAKLSVYWNASGSHETDMGFDNYKGSTVASGYQSGGRISLPGFGDNLNWWEIDCGQLTYDAVTAGMPATAKGPWVQATDNDMWLQVMQYVPDQQVMHLNGLYLNDKWTLNDKFIFNVGLRYDWYDVRNNSVGKLASNNALSPRLGMKWDITGDGAWVAGLSYNRMSGRPLEGLFQKGGYVGTARDWIFYANPANPFPSGWQHHSELQNLKYYDFSKGSYAYHDAPTFVKFDPRLKLPVVNEVQATLTYSFKSEALGNGFLRATAVKKTWGNLIDAVRGRYGTVTDAEDNTGYVTYWTNQPLAEKEYTSFILDGRIQKGGLLLQGNVSWEKVWGNYTNEGSSQPIRAAGIEAYNYVLDANKVMTKVYDAKTFSPSGNIITAGSRSPLSFNLIGAYGLENVLGRTSVGLNFSYRSAAYYNQARSVLARRDFPILSLHPDSKPLYLTQYLNGERGTGTFKAWYNLDASIQQDFKVFKAAGRTVNAYVKAQIQNVLNHQMQITFDTAYQNSQAVGTSALNAPWVPTNPATFGKPTMSADYLDARSFLLSLGLKF